MSTSSAQRYRQYQQVRRKKRRGKVKSCCLSFFLIAFALGTIIALITSAYLFFPQRINVLLLGLDYSDPSNWVARTDTIILSTFVLPEGYVGLLSIPRDLWVFIPGIGENRINTAHFFAEARQRGSGPQAAIETIEENFGVDIDYYVRIRFEGFRDIIDAMGGLDIKLDRPMAGYEAGTHHLTGRKALAFARNRTGSDDFFRMEHGQIVLKAIYKQLMKPTQWIRLPIVIKAFNEAIDTNIPTWLWPRIVFTLLRSGVSGIDNRTITREMTTPIITDQGANVLVPKWELINLLIIDIFEY